MAEMRCWRCGAREKISMFCVVIATQLSPVESQCRPQYNVTLCEDCKARLLEFLNVEGEHE